MKELKAKETKEIIFEIMSAFADYCDRHDLRYYMCGGTLLGAVRHKGFIPWDDDVDLLMPRPDFEKLHKLVKTDPIMPYYKLSGINAGDGDTPFAKILDIRTVIDSKYMNADRNLWIDIFPMDGLPDDEAECEKLLLDAKKIKNSFSRSQAKIGNGKNIARTILKIPAVLVLKVFGTKYFGKKLDKMARMYDFDKCEYVGGVSWSLGKGERMKKNEYIPYEDLEFNGKMFHAPACWDYYLSANYGDYMQLPPEEKRVTHDFVAYLSE